MKKNIVLSIILVLVILVASVSSVYAIDGFTSDKQSSDVPSKKHIHGENCIYSCEQDTINFSAAPAVRHSHIDHEDSDNCLYSCDHSINSYVSGSHGKITLPDEPLDRQGLKDLLDKFSGVKTNSLEEAKKVLAEKRGIEIEPAGPITNSDLKVLIDEFTGIKTDSFEESKKVLADMLDISVEELNTKAGSSSLYCMLVGHNIVEWGCTEDHGEPDEECYVRCRRLLTCYWGDIDCTWYDYLDIKELAHSWSVGWCGQTCTNCGIIQMFHEDGGCWYCS